MSDCSIYGLVWLFIILKIIHLKTEANSMSPHSGYCLGLLHYKPIVIYVISVCNNFISEFSF